MLPNPSSIQYCPCIHINHAAILLYLPPRNCADITATKSKGFHHHLHGFRHLIHRPDPSNNVTANAALEEPRQRQARGTHATQTGCILTKVVKSPPRLYRKIKKGLFTES
ncbi:hypothetical protein FKM82_005538 [Ascaphus truei]